MPTNVLDSILLSVKKLNSVAPDQTSFDSDFVMWINEALADVNQLGIGPADGFFIRDAQDYWDDFMDESILRDRVKTYIALHVRLFFDPPATSFTQSMMKDQLDEKAWRLKAAQEDLDREEAV